MMDTKQVLETWISLNEAIMEADEKQCQQLLKAELAGKKRKAFVLRIHSRLNKIRADRERAELGERL
jgi:hypothetical protein